MPTCTRPQCLHPNLGALVLLPAPPYGLLLPTSFERIGLNPNRQKKTFQCPFFCSTKSLEFDILSSFTVPHEFYYSGLAPSTERGHTSFIRCRASQAHENNSI